MIKLLFALVAGITLAASCTAIAKEEFDLFPIVDVNLCQENEIEVASCMLEGRGEKFISICASNEEKKASYYFGTKSKIELNVSFSPDRKIYRWLNSDTYSTFFGFNRAGYSYILEVPQETYGARAILYVLSSKDYFDYDSRGRRCTNNSFGEKKFVSDAIGDVDDEAVRYGEIRFPPN